MRTIGIAAALALVSAAAAQNNPAYDKILKIACEKGNPWRMPVPAAVDLKEMETPIKLYASDGQSVLLCNCTTDRAGKNTGVYVESDDFSERAALAAGRRNLSDPPVGSSKPRFAHYLPGGSCTTAASSTVALKPGDKTVETWGTFDAFEAK